MYEVHELAGIVAMANEKEQRALTEDIKVNGQCDPAVLWKGQIVDGRCRQLACETLGVELAVRELDSEMSLDEVAAVVKSLNTRRNLTMTQKIVSGYKQQLRTGETNGSVAKQWAISVPSLKNCKYMAKRRPELVDRLFDGKSVTVSDPDKGYDITTSKINTLARIVKKQEESKTLVMDTSEEVEFTVDGLIKTEAGKDYYYGLVTSLGITDVAVRMLLVELANLKFKVD